MKNILVQRSVTWYIIEVTQSPITIFIHGLNFQYNDKVIRKETLLPSSDKSKLIK